MGQQEEPRDEDLLTTVQTVICSVAFLLMIGGFVWLLVSFACEPPPMHPEYTVSIAGVDGLNLEATSGGGGLPTTVSPVFNLTVRVYNPGNGNSWDDGCVWGLSTAVVSYGDVFLGKGSVPPFCAKEKEVQERMATAWGDDVVLPRLLRERLSSELERGEAALDVKVTMPAEACSHCNDRVLVCSKVKIGGSSPPPCRVEYVRPMPAAGSTSTSTNP